MTEREGSELTEYPGFTVEYRDASHRYWITKDEERVPVVSVTSALKVLDKPALLGWAEAAGVEGALILERRGELDHYEPSESRAIVDLYKFSETKRNQGAGRGTSVHRVLEQWGQDRSAPDLTDFPVEHRGFVQALCAWLLRDRPEPSSTERVVGSWEYGYAGRMDMRAVIAGRDLVIDLKTSSRPRAFLEAHLQSRAYAIAEVECGNPPPDGCLIVVAAETGEFATVESVATDENWLHVLACHRAVRTLRGAIRQAERARERDEASGQERLAA